MKESISVSIGVMAHNEEGNIAALLDALLSQETEHVSISEIIVVSSGSTDRTDEVVRDYEQRYQSIRLFVQPERVGKAAAINLFIKSAQEDILVLESADTVPCARAIEELVLPLANEEIGMTGGQPLPTNQSDTLMGFGSQVVWRCHHLRNLVNRRRPKLGELIAFKRVFSSIHEQTAVDEAEIESIMFRKGYQWRYCPEAVVYNAGPSNVTDFIIQRKRVHLGNLDLKRRTGYVPLVGSRLRIFCWGVLQTSFSIRKLSWLSVLIAAEVWSLLCSKVIFFNRPTAPYKWEMIQSGRKPLPVLKEAA